MGETFDFILYDIETWRVVKSSLDLFTTKYNDWNDQ